MKVHVTNCSSFLWWMGHSNKLIEIIFWAVTPVSYIVGQKMAIYEWKFIITSNSIESADFFLSIEINEAVCQHKKLSSQALYPSKCVTIISWFHMWFSRSRNIRCKYQAIYQTKLSYYFTNEFEDSCYLILIKITNEQYDDWNILEFICMRQYKKPISKNTHNFR